MFVRQLSFKEVCLDPVTLPMFGETTTRNQFIIGANVGALDPPACLQYACV